MAHVGLIRKNQDKNMIAAQNFAHLQEVDQSRGTVVQQVVRLNESQTAVEDSKSLAPNCPNCLHPPHQGRAGGGLVSPLLPRVVCRFIGKHIRRISPKHICADIPPFCYPLEARIQFAFNISVLASRAGLRVDHFDITFCLTARSAQASHIAPIPTLAP